jgi:hypothetical protein
MSFLAHTSVGRLDGVQFGNLLWIFQATCHGGDLPGANSAEARGAASSIAPCAEAILFTLELQPQNGRLRVLSPRGASPQIYEAVDYFIRDASYAVGFFEFRPTFSCPFMHILWISRHVGIRVRFLWACLFCEELPTDHFSRPISIPLPGCPLRGLPAKAYMSFVPFVSFRCGGDRFHDHSSR